MHTISTTPEAPRPGLVIPPEARACLGAIAHRPHFSALQLAALHVIAANPGCATTALARAMGVLHPSASRLASQLAADGLIDYQRAQAAGRNAATWILRPTARGLALLRGEAG